MEVRVKGKGSFMLQPEASYGDLARQAGAVGALAAMEGDRVVELFRPVEGKEEVRFLTFDEPEGRSVFRHTSAHVLAQAVKRLYPGAQLSIGPAIEDGFYYDILFPEKITPDAFEAIEKEMEKVVRENHQVSRKIVARSEALKHFKELDDSFKVELIQDLPEDAEITFYTQGEFTDLCRGPHLVSTGGIGAMKLTSLAGAYWRGDEKRPMLQRIYGTSFPDAAALEHHLWLIEEARRRDHRKLGPELNLFSFNEVAPGFPFWHPHGLTLYETLLNFSRSLQAQRGYQEVATPWIMRLQLWERSGHSDHYRENMFLMESEEGSFGAKPMNCPAHCVYFQETTRSYRDLPMKVAEYGPLSRLERSGALHGLLRVRGFHQDDAHIFTAPEDVGTVIDEVIDLVGVIYDTLGLPYEVRLSTRPEDFMGEASFWDQAEASLHGILQARGLDYQVAEKEGAFYGPKLDFFVVDALSRKWQCATIQLDLQLPQRFDLKFIDNEGKERRPVMVHRAIMGSMERFLGILIEHFAGAFPVWLSPVQVKVLPITGNEAEFAKDVAGKLRAAGIRAEVDARNEKIGYRIRQAQVEKVPYMAVVGKREAEAGQVAVRRRGAGDLGPQDLEAFIARVQAEISSRMLDPVVPPEAQAAQG